MKTKAKFKRLLMIAGMFFVFVLTSMAESNEKVRVIAMSQKSVLLFVMNHEKQWATMNINKINTEEELYSKTTARDKIYRGIYDFSKVPEGDYKLSIDFNDKTYDKEIKVTSDGLEIIKEADYIDPEFSSKNNTLKVMFYNPANKGVSVSFSNGLKDFYTDNLPEQIGSFERSYNLKNLETGSYIVKLTSGDRKYLYSFDVPWFKPKIN